MSFVLFLKEKSTWFSFLELIQEFPEPLTETGVLQGIRDGTIYGIIECDVECNDRTFYENFPPIFKHAEVSRKGNFSYDFYDFYNFLPFLLFLSFFLDIGNYMLDIVKKLNTFRTPRKYLLSSFFAREQMFSTGKLASTHIEQLCTI